MGWLRVLKQQKLNAIESSAFKEETKQLLMALILDGHSELDRAWTDRYTQAGIVHILAISGLHIGLLMVLLGRFLSHYDIYQKEITYRFLWSSFRFGATPS